MIKPAAVFLLEIAFFGECGVLVALTKRRGECDGRYFEIIDELQDFQSIEFGVAREIGELSLPLPCVRLKCLVIAVSGSDYVVAKISGVGTIA